MTEATTVSTGFVADTPRSTSSPTVMLLPRQVSACHPE